MTATSDSEWLDALGTADEIEIAPMRADGTQAPYTTIWVVRVGDAVYVRSYRGSDGGWYRAAVGTGRARLRAGNTGRDVGFETADDVDGATIDAAYRAKYGRSSYVDAMVTDNAAATTLRLVPR